MKYCLVKEERHILQTTERREAHWIGHMLCRNCFLKHVIEIKIEGRDRSDGKRRRRCKQLLDDFKERRGYWKLKKDALDCTVWRSRFGRCCGHVVRQTTGRTDEGQKKRVNEGQDLIFRAVTTSNIKMVKLLGLST